MSSSHRPTRLDSLKIKAKLLQKAKRRAGRPIPLKDAFAVIASNAGFPSWRDLRETLRWHERLRPHGASALWSVWYATHAQAQAHLEAHGGYLLPYQRQFFICDDDYLRHLGVEPDDPEVMAVGRDWSRPRDATAWRDLLAKLERRQLDPRQLLPARLGAPQHVETLAKGLSGASVHAVTTATGRYVVRVFHGDGASWRRSRTAARLAGDLGVGPRVLHVDDAHQALVSELVAGIGFGAALADASSRGPALAGLIHQLRVLQSASAGGLAPADAMAFARSVFAEQAIRPGFPVWALALGGRLQDLDAVLRDDARRVPSHCDLNPNNLLWTGRRVLLIDWDGGGLAHPYLDLATITTFLGIPDDATAALAEQLIEAPLNDTERRRLRAVRALVCIVYGCVFYRLVPDLRVVAPVEQTRVTPLRDCLAQVASGRLHLHAPEGQIAVGTAFLEASVG